MLAAKAGGAAGWRSSGPNETIRKKPLKGGQGPVSGADGQTQPRVDEGKEKILPGEQEGTGNGGRKEEWRLPGEQAEETLLALLCLLFPNCSVKAPKAEDACHRLGDGSCSGGHRGWL